MKFPKFIIKKSTNDQFYFNLWSSDEEIILKSEMYTSKQNCKNGIESVKTNSSDDKNYEKKVSENSKFFFVLKSPSNGQTIGLSNLYSTSTDRDNGIKQTKSDAPVAGTEDLS
ncbi:YegP family protein [Flavobacterium sp. UBA7682]|uniref:YegP family protein n=1 Tax=Flavobacterium sp. UBA7682 TaxID=1946560 RepID=UPI0025C14955|nr:YegP family protein [Flavobacterium sp. UBA7682]